MLPLIRSRSAVLLGTVVLLALGLVALGSGSSPWEVSEEELQDLSAIATAEGITIAESIDGYGWRDDLSEVIHVMESVLPDDLSLSRKPSHNTAWISFKGEVPQAARDAIAVFSAEYPHVTVELRPNQGFSRKEKDAAIEAAHFAICNHPGTDTASTGFDHDTMSIRVEAKLSGPETISLDVLKSIAELDMKSTVRQDILSDLPVKVFQKETGMILDIDSEHRGGEERNSAN